jgi:hypothetical protein
LVEYKGRAATEQVRSALWTLKQCAARVPGAVPLLVVPHMGELGQELCRLEGVSWFDLSGNAHLTAPGLRIWIEGRGNLFKHPGRPVDLFAPRSSRIARVLLLSPQRTFTQSELARETGVDTGNVSRLLKRYEEAGFVARQQSGRKAEVRLADYDLLLTAWRHAYDFSVHQVRQGHLSARSGVETLQQVAGEFRRHEVDYAATGLAAAWLLAPFAAFRLVALYVHDWPAAEVLSELGFREEPRGSNLWLVLPKDEGVFTGGGSKDGIRHVSAVQTYLDLKAQSERADEAAEELRRQHLTGSNGNGG